MIEKKHKDTPGSQVLWAQPIATVLGSLVHWELVSPVDKIRVRDWFYLVRSFTPYEQETQTRIPFEFGTCRLDSVHGFFGCYALISLVTLDARALEVLGYYLFWVRSSSLQIEDEGQRYEAVAATQRRPHFCFTPI